MKRELILKGDSVVLDPGGSVDPGTSGYPWANTPSKQLYTVWNNLTPIPGEWGYCWPVNSPTQIAVGFEIGPTLARFTKVKITTGFDYAQTGPNNWWFPPDNAAGPSCAIILRKRDLATWLTGTGLAAHTMVYTGPPPLPDDCNVNLSTEPTVFRLYPLTWELTAHPEGGPWTLDDINDLAVGVQFGFTNGPNGKAYEPSQGSFFKIRVPYLTVTLEIEDLGGYVDNVRFVDSVALRLMRRARNVLAPKCLAHHAVGDVGSRVYFSHPRGPSVTGQGWGRRRLERRPGLILARKCYPESFKYEDQVFDLQQFACLGWAAYRVDAPWSPELQGLALVDKGRGFTHARAQDGWSARPGDGALMRALEGYPILSSEGLAVQGGGDVAVALRNYDLMQAGWSTVGSAGTFSAAADTDVVMAEEQGYLSSCRLTYGAGGGAGGRERSLGTLPRADGDFVHVRVILKNTSVIDPDTDFGEWYLKRSGGGLGAPEFWDEANRVWTTSVTYNPVPAEEVFGESIADAVPCDAPGASSDPTYAIGVGRFFSNIGPVTLHGAIVDVQHSDSTVAGARTPLVTLDAPLTRVADTHKMDQVWGRELWVHERGTAIVEVRPFWRAASLPDNAVKPLLHAQHAVDSWDALQFVAVAGDDDLIRFERAIDGESTYQLDCAIDGIDLTRAHVLRAWCRWLGADGWGEYGPYSVEVGYAIFLEADGTLVKTASVVGRLTSEVAIPYDRDHLAIGCDQTRQADAFIRMWETRRQPLHKLEAIWRV